MDLQHYLGLISVMYIAPHLPWWLGLIFGLVAAIAAGAVSVFN